MLQVLVSLLLLTLGLALVQGTKWLRVSLRVDWGDHGADDDNQTYSQHIDCPCAGETAKKCREHYLKGLKEIRFTHEYEKYDSLAAIYDDCLSEVSLLCPRQSIILA